ncbi:hypothetical protein IFM89_017010 [Coptis chinensis]|uniref:F-box associated beta-propeller type 3 domain-containing protein n=1 Tax=Coptis chinensis TaxID=261450 RepID=A0A835LN40_9MAGN|nr:hypothetical protein IFM89_017010 [Coptis chinensis]
MYAYSELYLAENNIDDYNKNLPMLNWKKVYEYNISAFESLCVLGSCNGILCLSLFIPGAPPLVSNIFMYNPITREKLPIPDVRFPECEDDPQFRSGFGFDVSEKKYKLVLVLLYKLNRIPIQNEVLIHTVGSKMWRRKVGIVPDELYGAHGQTSFLSVDGSLHWIAVKYAYERNNYELFIVSFSLGVEEFTYVPTPNSLVVNHSWHHSYHYVLGVLEEQLSFVDSSSCNFIKIWVRKSDNGKKCWIKQIFIQKHLVCRWGHEFVTPIKLRKSGEILFLVSDDRTKSKSMVSYNTESGKCRSVSVESKESKFRYIRVIPHEGSLMSLRSACGLDRDT